MNKPTIKSFINLFRNLKAKEQLDNTLIKIIIISIYIILFLGLLETIFYFSINIRLKIFTFFLLYLITVLLFTILRYYLNKNSIFNNFSDHSITKVFEKKDPFIKDRLLNTFQLENSIDKINKGKDLVEYAIKKLNNDLKNVSLKSLQNPISNGIIKTIKLTLLITLLVLLFFNKSLLNSYHRLLNPNKNFPIPLPFILSSLSGNQEVLGGDTLEIAISGYGDLPDSISIYLKDKEKIEKVIIPQKNEIYKFTFTNINKNTIYWAKYTSSKWLSTWKEIKTKPDTIFVIDRPIIQEIKFSVFPPDYTKEKKFEHPGNITDISVPKGSQIQLKSQTSKTLKSAWIMINEIKNDLYVQGNNLSGTFHIKGNTNISIYIEDQNGVENLNPSNYRISCINDYPPDIIIRNPNKEFEIDESSIINFNIQTSDDYGFSDGWIQYQIKAPEYLTQDTTIYIKKLDNFQNNVKSQQIYQEWDISNYSIAPDDEIHLQVVIADNNTLTGPSLTYSTKIIGFFPSMEDLFNRMEEEENKVEDYSNEIKMNMHDIKELVEELELELLKSEEVSWEHEQKASATLEKMDEIFNQIEQVEETLKKIQEQAENNKLVNEDLINKFTDFQELLDEIMTQEILEAMEKLQESIDEMDPQKMLDALQDFEFDAEAFEKQLDRFIDMFEMALAEQKMDEVIKRLEKLVDEQNAIVKELENDNANLSKLASRERRQEENFKTLENTIQEASNMIENISSQSSQYLSDLANSELSSSTKSDIQNSRIEMQNENYSNANNLATNAQSGLNQMLEISQEIQSQFQDDTVKKMLRKLLALIQNLLYISKQQEKLISETKNLRSRSPKLIDSALQQDRILRQNQQFMNQLVELSKETFHISPQIASTIGKTKNAMDRTISQLEQKQTSSAKKEMKAILKGLNETAMLLIESANEMQMSGSGSGMAQFMEQMEQMSQQQQGINQGTMNLPQMSMMAQQQMMNKLQQQQEQLKQQLEELLNQNPSQQTGGLSQVNKEMEDVIDDFRRKQVDRKTQERQQRILSRMLDSQKSMTQKDYSEKRKSNIGQETIYSGPTGLPSDMGQREMLIINAMESALKEGHSREYQNMMKQYFLNLQQGSDKINE